MNPQPASEPSSARVGAATLLRVVGPFLSLGLVFTLFAILRPETFLSLDNLRTVPAQTVIVAIGAIGMTLIIASGGIDLSVGSSIALTTVVTAIAIRKGLSPGVAALCGVASGGLVGVINGLLISWLRIVPFIVTLGTLGVFRGVAKYLADEKTVNVKAGWLESVMATSGSGFAPGVWIAVAVAVLMVFVLRFSVLGTHAYAIGSNEATARLCGIRVARTRVLVYGIAGLLTGLAGVMRFCELTVGDPTTAVGEELDIIAAVVIGGGSLSGGEGTVLGSLVGALMMAVLRNGCTLADVPTYANEIVIGLIIVAAVAFDRLRHSRSA